MRIIKTSFLFLVAGAAMITSCKNSKYPGFEQSETGLYYQFHHKTEGGQKPNLGEYVKVSIIDKLYPDSVLFDSKNMGQDGSIQYPLIEEKFKGCLEEGIKMMSIGDSASFLISSDSIQKYFPAQGKAPMFASGSMQKFSIKLQEITPKDVMQKKQQEQREAAMQHYKQAEAASIEKYIADNKITVNPSEKGLYYMEQKKGTGPKIQKGQTVSVLYTGKYLNGEVFDASEKHGGTPLPFKVGEPGLIEGWQEAILLMQKGTKATILVPSSSAYGDGGGRMPPFTPLLFEMEVVDVK